MLSVYKAPRRIHTPSACVSSDYNSNAENPLIIPPGRPYVTKVNGKLVMAREKKKTLTADMAIDLMGEAFGSNNRIIRRYSMSAKQNELVDRVFVNGLPYTREQPTITQAAPITQGPLPTGYPEGQQPMLLYPPPPPSPFYPGPGTYLIQAPPAPLPQPITTQAHTASAEPNENEKISETKTTITITKHICANCGRLRSRKYHQEHPIKEGETINAAYCRKCQKDASSTSDSEEEAREKRHKKDRREKKERARSKKHEKKSSAESSSDESEIESPPLRKVKSKQKPKPARKLSSKSSHPKKQYIIIEDVEEDTPQETSRAAKHETVTIRTSNDEARESRSSFINLFKPRRASTVAPQSKNCRSRKPHSSSPPASPAPIPYRHVRVASVQQDEDQKKRVYPKKIPVQFVDDEIHDSSTLTASSRRLSLSATSPSSASLLRNRGSSSHLEALSEAMASFEKVSPDFTHKKRDRELPAIVVKHPEGTAEYSMPKEDLPSSVIDGVVYKPRREPDENSALQQPQPTHVDSKESLIKKFGPGVRRQNGYQDRAEDLSSPSFESFQQDSESTTASSTMSDLSIESPRRRRRRNNPRQGSQLWDVPQIRRTSVSHESGLASEAYRYVIPRTETHKEMERRLQERADRAVHDNRSQGQRSDPSLLERQPSFSHLDAERYFQDDWAGNAWGASFDESRRRASGHLREDSTRPYPDSESSYEYSVYGHEAAAHMPRAPSPPKGHTSNSRSNPYYDEDSHARGEAPDPRGGYDDERATRGYWGRGSNQHTRSASGSHGTQVRHEPVSPPKPTRSRSRRRYPDWSHEGGPTRSQMERAERAAEASCHRKHVSFRDTPSVRSASARSTESTGSVIQQKRNPKADKYGDDSDWVYLDRSRSQDLGGGFAKGEA